MILDASGRHAHVMHAQNHAAHTGVNSAIIKQVHAVHAHTEQNKFYV